MIAVVFFVTAAEFQNIHNKNGLIEISDKPALLQGGDISAVRLLTACSNDKKSSSYRLHKTSAS